MVENNFSIIIPAYNESALINETLAYLFSDNRLTNIEIIVVCNGCIDDTVEKVQLFISDNSLLLSTNGISMFVFETNKASKTNALNIGVKKSNSDINVFLDADILINGCDIQQLVTELNVRKLKAISPTIIFDFSQSSFLVRQYYKVVSQSYYNLDYRLSNVIALSAAGIEKIGILPEVIADDDFIRKQFTKTEHAVSKHCSYRFLCAKTFGSLFQVLTRVERGNMQLVNYSPKLQNNQTPRGFHFLPIHLFPFFVAIKLLVIIRANIQFLLGNISQWERDESNRKSHK